MTQRNPMQEAYTQLLHSYNPLEIKDILIHGASRKATHHKTRDDIMTYYANYNEGIHHNLLDAKPEFCKMYLLCQAAYTHSEKTEDDQYYFLRDVVWLYIDGVCNELGDEYQLNTKTREEVQDEMLAIDLKHRKAQLHVIDGGKA